MRVRTSRQHLHTERASQASLVERFLPEPRAFDRGRAKRFGDAGIDVVDDRFAERAVRIVRVHALEAMTRDPALLERALNRLRVILERDAEEANPRVERAWPVFRIGQLDERDVLSKRERSAIRNDRRDRFARAPLAWRRSTRRRSRVFSGNAFVYARSMLERSRASVYVPSLVRESVPDTSSQSR